MSDAQWFEDRGGREAELTLPCAPGVLTLEIGCVGPCSVTIQRGARVLLQAGEVVALPPLRLDEEGDGELSIRVTGDHLVAVRAHLEPDASAVSSEEPDVRATSRRRKSRRTERE
jgi:hypothetical protein